MPGWTDYYLNYKVGLSGFRLLSAARMTPDNQALKKIINSYAAGRPASDASLLSLGQRPAKRTYSETTTTRIDDPAEPSFSLDSDSTPLDELDIPTTSLTASRGHGNGHGTPISSLDLDPLPPETEPPAPSRTSIMDSRNGSSDGRNESFKAHRDVFFFTLQRELEKVRPVITY